MWPQTCTLTQPSDLRTDSDRTMRAFTISQYQMESARTFPGSGAFHRISSRWLMAARTRQLF